MKCIVVLCLALILQVFGEDSAATTVKCGETDCKTGICSKDKDGTATVCMTEVNEVCKSLADGGEAQYEKGKFCCKPTEGECPGEAVYQTTAEEDKDDGSGAAGLASFTVLILFGAIFPQLF